MVPVILVLQFQYVLLSAAVLSLTRPDVKSRCQVSFRALTVYDSLIADRAGIVEACKQISTERCLQLKLNLIARAKAAPELCCACPQLFHGVQVPKLAGSVKARHGAGLKAAAA